MTTNGDPPAMTYTLTDLAAGREAKWANVPACAIHYPKPCNCVDDGDGEVIDTWPEPW